MNRLSDEQRRLKQNERQRLYRAKNPEKVTEFRARYKDKNKDKILERQRLSYTKKRPIRIDYKLSPAAFYGPRNRAKKNGWEFDLTREFLDSIAPDYCPVLGIKLRPGSGKGPSDDSYSVDRIDSKRGYTRDNVIIVSWRANNLKSNGTIDELQKIVDFYRSLS